MFNTDVMLSEIGGAIPEAGRVKSKYLFQA